MTIPISDVVAVNAGVIGTGGSPLSLNGLILSKSVLLPTGGPQSFASPEAVSDFFGGSSDEYSLSKIYFGGYANSTIKPGTIFFAPYNASARGAWLQSGSMASVTLLDLQAFSGILTITVDGSAFTSSNISLATATSYSDAATKITAGFTGLGAPTCTWNAINSTFSLASPTTGAISTITYATGTLSGDLKFTSATGAILSQGAEASTPASAMDAIKVSTQRWVTFATIWHSDLAEKILFAEWSNSQNNQFLYVCWDLDGAAIVNGSTSCFGAVAKDLGYNGVACVYNTKELAAFVLGCIASIDFTRENGRITTAFKSQGGFSPTVEDQQISRNLLENGYSFYGSYGTRTDEFKYFYNGQVPGVWKYIDPFINQIFLNSQIQLALISLLTAVSSIPYSEEGYSLIRAAMIDPIANAIFSGIIRTGVTLSEAQKAQVNNAAGRDVATTIEQQGYYLQVIDPGAQVRGERESPVVNLWYTDGGAIQKITVASINIL